MRAFPPKAVAQSITKANVFLDEVARDLWSLWPTLLQRADPYLRDLHASGASHDQATAFLFYAACLTQHTPHALPWAHFCVSEPKKAKEVSNFLKAVGANASSFGSLLVETETMQGRGVVLTDLRDDAVKRTDIARLEKDDLASFDNDRLRQAIKKILDLEVSHTETGRLDFPSLEEHWDSRWSWAVNGSHSSQLGRELHSLPWPKERIHKIHRRAWLEAVEADPRVEWDGTTYVSSSPKFETGKTRAIFACDTRSYLAFEHLMQTLEANWRGTRVILNPGKGGHIGMAERVTRCRNRSGISLMLDYDDFNSHHTNAAMAILIDETCKKTGYPAELAAPLVASFSKQKIFFGGKYIGVSAGTLMSGHRCTTYINSVLNMAYLMCVLGDDYVLERPTMHVGDDVYFGARDYRDAGYIVTSVMNSRLRMNRTKQSVGHVSTEFLRVASDKRDSYGYLARAIAATIAGNWVSDKLLDPYEALTTMVSSARTLANRARSSLVPLLLVSSVRRVVASDSLDDTKLKGILLGAIAINDGPQFHSSGGHARVSVRAEFVSKDDFGYSVLPSLATSSYLSKCATVLEINTLNEAGISVQKQMLRSSWDKSLTHSDKSFEKLIFGNVERFPSRGSVRAEDLIRTPKPPGVLLKYPLLVLAKERLPAATIARAVAAAGGNPHVNDLALEAWGEYSNPAIVNTVLSYSDAATLAKRTAVSVLTSTRRCYV
nr:RNA dependent RNA polymerase [Erysiphe necator associated victorivirus 2]